ncbi:MAG: ABC transporter ATP-binding protein [Planctomycetes bacterium]|nr:ABC transporter ATP-binding protein [Planctomycetota bacterium]MBI3845663.1 ABC transporter ATP-binding protein [Planctomycetota bacterium]
MQAKLSVRGLSKTYRDFWGRRRVEALREVSFDVEPGEIFALLGPNGSGKTTLLKALLGLVRPTGGTATIGGETAGSIAARRLCGYLPEESTFPMTLRAREAIRLFGEVIGLDRSASNASADRLIDALGLGEFAERRLRQLSRGTLRRVGFALALLGDPPVLLLDEPTSGMDPLAAGTVRDELRKRATAGATIVLSTHLASDVEGVAHRVLILAHGRVLASDSVDRLLRRDGVTQLLVEGLDATGMASVASTVTSAGGRVIEGAPARESLDRVFAAHLRRETTRDAARS